MKYTGLSEHDSCGIGAVVSIDNEAKRSVVDDALRIVERLAHRAGVDEKGDTGDGAGILVGLGTFFAKIAQKEQFGVGMFFFPKENREQEKSMRKFEQLCQKTGLAFDKWRAVPVDETKLGCLARSCAPSVWQAFVVPQNKERLDPAAFERKLYLLRRSYEKTLGEGSATYVVSLSSKTIVYKGLLRVDQLRSFYLDLQAEDFTSSVALVHSRFSTNTQPSWKRAHPYRLLCHNGEINTIRGNADRMFTREETLHSTVFSDEEEKITLPAIDMTGSDSAMLDNALEFFKMNGMELPQAVSTCIPEPYKINGVSSERRDYYHYWSTMMEEWDGPASLLFFDGDVFGATLDRNGLRPSRYYLTCDNMLVLSSEVGVLPIDESKIVKKARLSPGKMLLVDLQQKRLISDDEIKHKYAMAHPYGEWLAMNLVQLHDLPIPNKKIPVATQDERDKLYRAYGWNYEDVNEMILQCTLRGSEPIGSMGVDTPLAFLSEKHPSLFGYFKQRFAEVTNPPIDSIRERLVTDTTVYVGSDGNMLSPMAESCRVLQINNPILTGVDIIKIKALDRPGLRTQVVPILYDKKEAATAKDLKAALDNLFVAIEKAYHTGHNIIILSDRGTDEQHLYIPALLAVSAVEQYLIRTKRRTAISVILESAQVKDVHEAAMVLSYGARALNPYLAHECIAELIDQKLLDKDYHTAIDDYNKALINGIVKVASKMGVSTIQSYQSAQIFEAVGISKEVVDEYFTNTVSRIGGIGLQEIAEDVLFHHNKAFDPMGLAVNTHLDSVGVHKMRRGSAAEDHLYNPQTIIALQTACRSADYAKFKEYTALVDDEKKPHTLRALLAFDFARAKPIPIDETESVDEIVQHFKTGAMSYGSISQEAHECLAMAMNHLHGKSNSGEGGEIRARLGTDKNSAIKQVASARFGVTEEYLLSATEIQIKMAQGAKPGEGGHLPGKKVYPWIAQTRYSTPGVALISPPPHHDIYSIEDLAQLIFDLKNANPTARISVKLVSEAGVGTIACGVAKAGAQVILISGHDGGTGAAPLSSIHHAGLPWELGVAETQRALVDSNLRGRVNIETDGKLMSGRDVAIACLLGAEEFGFATAPLVVSGCMMMRACQKDTCPFGVATQNKDLRKHFSGKPEYVEFFMKSIAQELREIMAALGFRTIGEMCGHSEFLRKKDEGPFSRAPLVDLSEVLKKSTQSENAAHFDSAKVFDFKLGDTLDEKTLIPWFNKIASNKAGTFGEVGGGAQVDCTNRAVGTILGSRIEQAFHGDLGEDAFVVNLKGSAGQSFGAFIPRGLTLRLEGDANDYVGKGLSGGKLVVLPSRQFKGSAHENIIIGNVALYGATSGKAFICGVAGERFAVRNSGAVCVVEGTGDHGCEYMTGGVAVVLGKTGKNFAAGMSGGVAYVLDCEHTFYERLNSDIAHMTAVSDQKDVDTIRALVTEHVQNTGSERGKWVLANFSQLLGDFKKVIARDYETAQEAIGAALSQGATKDEAAMQAYKAVIG